MQPKKAYLTATEYYFENKGKVEGPLSLQDIKEKKLLLTTLVWRYGLDNWTPALEMDELNHLFKQGPPPLPSITIKKTPDQLLKKAAELKAPKNQAPPQYDDKYNKEVEATTAGIFLLVIPLLFIIFYDRVFYKSKDFSYLITISIIGAAVIRAIASIWVMYIAKHQNRDAVRWLMAALLLPSVTLMIIGQQKKLYDPEEWKKFLYSENRKKQNALFHAIISEKTRN